MIHEAAPGKRKGLCGSTRERRWANVQTRAWLSAQAPHDAMGRTGPFINSGNQQVNTTVSARLRPATLSQLNPFISADIFQSLKGAPHDVNAGLRDVLPSGPGFIALLEAFRATGGTAPGDVLGRLLEEHCAGSAVSLAKLVHTGQVFGLEWRNSLWIPMFQFDPDDLSLRASAQQVRALLPQLWSGWTLAAWFARANPLLGGSSPADMLDADLPAVIDAALAQPGADAG